MAEEKKSVSDFSISNFCGPDELERHEGIVWLLPDKNGRVGSGFGYLYFMMVEGTRTKRSS